MTGSDAAPPPPAPPPGGAGGDPAPPDAEAAAEPAAGRPQPDAPVAAEPIDDGREAGTPPPPFGRRSGDGQRFGSPGRPLSRSQFAFGFVFALGALTAFGVFRALDQAAPMLVLVFSALFLAIGLNPAVEALQRLRMRRGFAVLLVALSAVGIFGGGLLALVPPLVHQSKEFATKLPEYIQALNRSATVRDLDARYQLIDKLQGAVTADRLSDLAGGLVGGAGVVFGTLFKVLTVFVLTLYFMASFNRLRTRAYQLVPASRRERVQLLGDAILVKVGAYLVGALSIALLAGLSAFGFLYAMGVSYSFALAFVVAVCDLIPQIGATLGAVVVSLAGFATSVPVGIACLVFFVVYQQVENYLIYPKIMRRSVKVSDLAAIVAALTGVALFGVIGALVAIPAVAAIQLVIDEVVVPRQQRH
ncbi:AI-2E family transporter [Pilimelia terevasa]|uniref:AI-2E family transporter n=1 Tax=Pilimelia terevasa TaxID=53372 RepID=A0A8J3FGZ4_9ACTN|nr:AI-2E family transporter [Pilimelia terevasa]GGK19161.1 AI-2E family transporter [Pilimelia terevasa]